MTLQAFTLIALAIACGWALLVLATIVWVLRKMRKHDRSGCFDPPNIQGSEMNASACSMHCRGTVDLQPMPSIPEQPRIHAQHMVIGRIPKRFMGQLRGIVKKSIGFIFGHGGIVEDLRGVGHSWFPRVGDEKNFASIGTGN